MAVDILRINNQGYNWYFVRTKDHTGYPRGDCVRQLTDAEVTAYLVRCPARSPR